VALAAALGSQTTTAMVQVELADAAAQTAVLYAAGQPMAAGIAPRADGFLKALARARLARTLGLVSALGALGAVIFLLWFFPRSAGPALRPLLDQDKLQGSWQVLAIEKVGQPREENPRMRFVFAGDQLTVVVVGTELQPMRVVLNPSQEPKTVDFTMQTGKILRAIYQLDGDSLQLCLDFDMAGTGGKRPTSFRPEAGGALLGLRREQPLPNRP
jgi:uncharacterized protein (TIGR03067 family)